LRQENVRSKSPGEVPLKSEVVEFDQYAENYDAALVHLSWASERREDFAARRIEWLGAQLKKIGVAPKRVMDFGCGTGSSIPFLFSVLGVESVIAVDVSRKSLEVAERNYGSGRVQFVPYDEYEPREPLDLVFCNGVFHHIPVIERAGAINLVRNSLGSGGLFALWENNPWNPVIQLLMALAPIDRDAIKLLPSETRRLLDAGGFEVMQTDFLFIFPRLLRWFRVLEPYVARMALGLQYQVLAKKKL